MISSDVIMDGQSGRGGRERSRRDYPSRSEERSHHGRSSAPPSRHLWVGNLSHNLSERTLKEHFLRFGELESLAFQPGRSYAFVNYKHDEEAFAAIRALQGFFVAGNSLKIEFAKGVSPANLWLLSLLVYLMFCLRVLSDFNYLYEGTNSLCSTHDAHCSVLKKTGT